MPCGCFAALCSLSYYLQFLLIPHGGYCVLHATSFITSFVPLRSITSSIHFSSVQSTRCQYICARRRCHRLRYGLRLAQTHAYASMPRQSPSLCVHRSLRSLYCPPQPVALAGNSVRTSLHCLWTARPALRADKCAARLCF